MYKVGIITASDTRHLDPQKDESGQVIREMLSFDYQVTDYAVVPDEKELLIQRLKTMVDDLKVDLILTTGGTGFSYRDVTPEATLAVIDKEVPGLAEAIRNNSLQYTKKAMLSRAVAGIRKKTLIINLPGSPKAVRECLSYILEIIPHGLDVLRGNVSECAR